MTAPVRGDWHWTPRDEALLYKRRRQGARLKQLSHEFGRSEKVISERIRKNETLMQRECREILNKHYEEEAALLEKLLAEQDSFEKHGDER
jgi:hypothetical protein